MPTLKNPPSLQAFETHITAPAEELAYISSNIKFILDSAAHNTHTKRPQLGMSLLKTTTTTMTATNHKNHCIHSGNTVVKAKLGHRLPLPSFTTPIYAKTSFQPTTSRNATAMYSSTSTHT